MSLFFPKLGQTVVGLLGLDASRQAGTTSVGREAAVPKPRSQKRQAPGLVPAFPKGVDWNFVIREEGGNRKDGYVPVDAQKRPLPKSGVTIAAGFDLGNRTPDELRELGLSEDLVHRFTPYLRLKGAEADKVAKACRLDVSQQEADTINSLVFNRFYKRVADRYDAAARGGRKFESLPMEAQTAISDLAHQYGPAFMGKTPKYWSHVTNDRWDEAARELENFGDAHRDRRVDEAKLIRSAIKAGRLR